MNYELGIPADIRGKLGFPLDGLSGRASSEETVASARSIPYFWVKPKVTHQISSGDSESEPPPSSTGVPSIVTLSNEVFSPSSE